MCLCVWGGGLAFGHDQTQRGVGRPQLDAVLLREQGPAERSGTHDCRSAQQRTKPECVACSHHGWPEWALRRTKQPASDPQQRQLDSVAELRCEGQQQNRQAAERPEQRRPQQPP